MKKRNRHSDQPPAHLSDLDPELTSEAERAYERIVSEEGYSEEQAFSIAFTRLGKEGGHLDGEEETEDELTVRDEEPLSLTEEEVKVGAARSPDERIF